MKIRHSCDRHIVLGLLPAAEFGVLLGIEFELVQGDFDLFAMEV